MRTLLACLLVLPLFSGFAHAQGSSCAFIRGDANGSEEYQQTTDYTYILEYMYQGGAAPDPLDAGDANDDGVIDVSDVTYLANYDASSGPAPPPPFSSAGYDPTPDEYNVECDAILSIHPAALTSYLPAAASTIQDIRPLVTQRGVGLDGSLRAALALPMHTAGNPVEASLLGNEVISEATGTFEVFDVDLALPASGFAWVVGRTYNARQQTSGGSARDSNGFQGRNWFQSSQPEVVHFDGATDSKDVVYLIYGADRFVEFKRLDKTGTSSTTFRATNGAAGVMVFTSGGASVPDTYAYTDQHGYTHTFFGFDGDAGSAAGQYWKTVDPDNQVAFVGHATNPATAISSGYSSGRILKAYDTADRRYTYTYTSLNGTYRLTEVKAETKTGGTWDGTPTGVTEVASVEYAYYGDESHGDIGDLKSVTVSLPLTDAGDSVQKRYYRYYEGAYNASTNPGYPHHLKLVLGPEGTRNFDYNGGTPDSTFDDDFLTASTDDLKPYGAAHFTYDTSHRVASCWLSGACGCSSGLTGTHTLTYATNGSDNATLYDEDEWRYRTVVERPDGGFVSLYFDEVGQPLARVLTDADPSGSPTKTWSTKLERDSAGVVVQLSTPANVTGYTHSSGAFTTSTSAGLVHTFVRETTPNLKGYLLDRKWSDGTSGSAYLDGTLTYGTATLTVGASKVVRPFVASTREYPQAITSGTAGSNLTEIATTVHSGTLMPEIVTVTLPDVVEANNGEGTTPTTTVKEYFTLAGENTFSRSMDGIITYRAFSGTTGLPTTLIEDADTTSLGPPSGGAFDSSGTELHRQAIFTYDAQGRITRTVVPDGQNKDMYYTQLADRRLVTLSYNDTVSTTYYGPVQYQVVNQAGQPEAMALITLPSNASTASPADHIYETYDDPLEAVNGSWGVEHLVTTLYDPSGSRRTEQRTYFVTPASPTFGAGNATDNYDPVQYGYDDSGRVWRVEEAHGTVTRTVRDLSGNTLETWVGTNDNDAYFPGGDTSGTANMVKTAAYVYDGGNGGGNQYLTSMTAYVVDGTTNQRVTTFTNDVRGRSIIEARPVAPHALHKYDNLGRQVARGLYSSTGSLTVSSDPTSVSGSRLALSQTFFDERGRVWKSQRHKIDASDGSDDDSLQTLTWYDKEGRLAKVDGEQLVKYAYDRLGRRTRQFVLAQDDDSTSYTAAIGGVTGDHVLEEYQTVFSGVTNEVSMEAALRRHHSTTATGALDPDGVQTTITANGSLTGRPDIIAHWYDDLSRRTNTVRYGTYGGSTFDRSSLPSTAPASSTTALTTSLTYDTAGRVQDVTDPEGIVSRRTYDHAGRVVKQIGNFSGGGTPSGSDDNRTVAYAYSNGLRATITLDTPSADQVTTYTYGTVRGTSPGDSAIATGHLLQKVQYPNSAGGSDVVTFGYNAQGGLTWRQDQAGNVLERVLDTGGRLTDVKATTVDADFNDDVLRVTRGYTSLGQLTKVTQYDAVTSGTVVNEVELTWDGWGKLVGSTQDHDAPGSGLANYSVDYAWTKATNGRNTLRVSSLTLPSADDVTYTYDATSNCLDEAASRVTFVHVNRGTAMKVAAYEYLGEDLVVRTDYPQPAVETQFYVNASPAAYGLLDRFNRVSTWYWERYAATGNAAIFYDVDYAYDLNSNVTTITDNVHKDVFDTTLTRDDLDRATMFSSDRMYFGLGRDHAGNWVEFDRDLGNDANFCDDTFDLDERRTFNAGNELDERVSYCSGVDDIVPLWDEVGNLIDDGEGREFVYDVFYRLLKIVDASTPRDLAYFSYDGLNRLIGIRIDVDEDGFGSEDPWRRLVYDGNNRVVANFLDSESFPSEEFVWNQQGSGSALSGERLVLLRDLDGNADGDFGDAEERRYFCYNSPSVVATVDASGGLRSWIKYGPGGVLFTLPPGDVNSNGGNAEEDFSGAYDARKDVDLDGTVETGAESDDEGWVANNQQTLGFGVGEEAVTHGWRGALTVALPGASLLATYSTTTVFWDPMSGVFLNRGQDRGEPLGEDVPGEYVEDPTAEGGWRWVENPNYKNPTYVRPPMPSPPTVDERPAVPFMMIPEYDWGCACELRLVCRPLGGLLAEYQYLINLAVPFTEGQLRHCFVLYEMWCDFGPFGSTYAAQVWSLMNRGDFMSGSTVTAPMHGIGMEYSLEHGVGHVGSEFQGDIAAARFQTFLGGSPFQSGYEVAECEDCEVPGTFNKLMQAAAAYQSGVAYVPEGPNSNTYAEYLFSQACPGGDIGDEIADNVGIGVQPDLIDSPNRHREGVQRRRP